jgi:hypothetical protein
MKQIGLWLGLAMAALATASAQVTVEVTLDQDQFLPGEAILAAVRIVNHSGRILRLGAEEDWLNFSLESRGVDVIPKTGDVPVLGEFFLGSSKVATKWVNLSPYFSLGRHGRYSIVATVRVKDLDRSFTSPPKSFDIIEGARLWEQEIGVPNATNATTEVRKYILEQANYLKNQLRLYLRIIDPSNGKVFCVVPIGPMVSFGQPEPQVDKFNNLHVLYQDRAHSFDYSVYNPQGAEVVHQTYDYIGSRPRLQPDNEGKVLVKGGVLRQEPSESPAAQVPPLSNSQPKSASKPGDVKTSNPSKP